MFFTTIAMEKWLNSYGPITKDGSTILVENKRARLFYFCNGQVIIREFTHDDFDLTSAHFSSNDNFIITTAINGTVKIWPLQGGSEKTISIVGGQDFILLNSATMSKDSDTLLLKVAPPDEGKTCELWLWSISKNKCLQKITI